MSTQQRAVVRLRDEQTRLPYFIKTELDGDQGGDDEAKQFDVTCTDGSRCWTAKGARQAGTSHQDWSMVVLNGLQHPKSSERTTFTAEAAALKITFFRQKQGSSLTLKYPLHLVLVDDAGAVIAGILDLVLDNSQRLQARCSQLQLELNSLQASLMQLEHLRQEVACHREKDEAHFIKFAAILNEKKRHISELEEQLAAHQPASDNGSSESEDGSSERASSSRSSGGQGELPQGGSEERSAGEPGSLAGPLPLRPSVDMGAETQLITPPASPAGRQSQPSPQQAPAATGPPASPPAEPGGGESSGPGASQQQQQPLPRVTRRATGRRRRA